MGYDKDLFNKAVSLKQDAQNQANLSGFIGSFVQGFQQARAAEEQRQTNAELIGLLNASYGDSLNLPRRVAGQVPTQALLGLLMQRKQWEAVNQGMSEYGNEKNQTELLQSLLGAAGRDPSTAPALLASHGKSQYPFLVRQLMEEAGSASSTDVGLWNRATEAFAAENRRRAEVLEDPIPWDDFLKSWPGGEHIRGIGAKFTGGRGGPPSPSPGPGPDPSPTPGLIGWPASGVYPSPIGPEPPPPLSGMDEAIRRMGPLRQPVRDYREIDRMLFQTMPGAKAEVPPDPVTPPPVKPATPASIAPVGGVGPRLEFSGMEPLTPGRSGLSDRGRALKDARRAAREGRVDEETPLSDEEKEDLVRRLAETMKRMGM